MIEARPTNRGRSHGLYRECERRIGRIGSVIVKHLSLALVLTLVCVVGSSHPGFARGGGGGAHGSGLGLGRGARGVPPPPTPSLQGRIPAPLPSTPLAPIINGPLNSNGLPSTGGAR